MPVLEDELGHMLDLAVSGQIWTVPPFDQTDQNLRRLNDVAFSGDGEPTSFPGFGKACELAADLLTARGLAPSTKIVVITNATLFHQPRVQQALHFLDRHNGEIWAKLEAGTDGYYRLIERTSIPLRRVLDNILLAGRARPIVIQSLFMNVNDQPPADDEISAYVGRLRDLVAGGCQIKLVQVYTVARTTAEAYVTPLDPSRLDAIAGRVSQALVPVETYYGPA
jgi:wyosine [tRNA(Phe)-imidazoG37] synthetase (radical SAM superfamily)